METSSLVALLPGGGQPSHSPGHWLHAPPPQRVGRWEEGLLGLPSWARGSQLTPRLLGSACPPPPASISPCPLTLPLAGPDAPAEERHRDSPRAGGPRAAGTVLLSRSSSRAILAGAEGGQPERDQALRPAPPTCSPPHLLHPGERSWGRPGGAPGTGVQGRDPEEGLKCVPLRWQPLSLVPVLVAPTRALALRDRWGRGNGCPCDPRSPAAHLDPPGTEVRE